MRRSLLALCLLTVPLAAHADQIDDFVLADLPSNPFLGPPLTFSAYATGVGNESGRFVDIPIFNLSIYNDGFGILNTLRPPTAFNIVSPINIDPAWLTYTGDLQATNPTYTFNLGTYAAYDVHYPYTYNYTLTITAESSTPPSPIPEPTPLLLVATGLLSCATLAHRKLLCRSATPIR